MEVRKIAFLQREDIDARDPWYAAREPDPRYNVTSSPCSFSLRPALFQSQGWLRERYEYAALPPTRKIIHFLGLLSIASKKSPYQCCIIAIRLCVRCIIASVDLFVSRWRDGLQFPKRSANRPSQLVYSLQLSGIWRNGYNLHSFPGGIRFLRLAIWYKTFPVRIFSAKAARVP